MDHSLLQEINQRVSDPGKFVPRKSDHNGPEPVPAWSARAIYQLVSQMETMLRNAADRLNENMELGTDPLAQQIYQRIENGWESERLKFHLSGRHNSAGASVVYLNGDLLLPNQSLALRNHSPDGFSWGYAGSGPSQLALAILLRLTGDKEFSLLHYQDFTSTVIKDIPKGEFHQTITWTPNK